MQIDIRSVEPYRLDAMEEILFNSMQSALKDQNEMKRSGPDLKLTINKIGNRPDYKKRLNGAKNKINDLVNQIDVFQPRFTIPFASFIWFSNQENYYMNDAINKIDSIESIIYNAKSTPIILYPGDEYSIDDKINNSESVKKYMESYMNINTNNLLISKSVDLEDLRITCKEFSKRIKSNYPFKWAILSFYPIKFFVEDLDAVRIAAKEIPRNK